METEENRPLPIDRDRCSISNIFLGARVFPREVRTLLREMEGTPHSGQCNHERPTYVELKLSDIERLFGRR